MSVVDETPWTDTPWADNWTENETSNLGETYTGENEETSWNDDWYVGHVNFDDWWYGDWDWTSWNDDCSWDQTWISSWNEPSSSSPPSLQESQNRTSVTVTELPSSSTSASGVKVSAVTSGPPPGTGRTSSSRTTGNTSRSKSMLLSAITLGTFGVGNSVLVDWTSFDPNL